MDTESWRGWRILLMLISDLIEDSPARIIHYSKLAHAQGRPTMISLAILAETIQL